MLSKFLHGKKKSVDNRVTSRRSKGKENPLNQLIGVDSKDLTRKSAGDVVLNDADRQLYRFDLPKQEKGFSDLINSFTGEGMFPYAAITKSEDESHDARMRRLVNLQPRINFRKLDIPDHISLKFFKEVEEFPMNLIVQLSHKQKDKTNYDYILMKRVSIIFSPLSSFFDSHSDVVVTIMDARKRSGLIARRFNLTDNDQYKVEGSLDYCFPKASADKVSLSFAQDIPTFNTGEQWGACQIFLEVEESDYPQSVAFKESIGLPTFATSMLEDYKYDPTTIDLAVRNMHRRDLREMYLNGQIADETEPQSEKLGRVTYAKSSGVGLKQEKKKPQGALMGPDGFVDWSTMNLKKPNQMPIGEQDDDEDDDDGLGDNEEILAKLEEAREMAEISKNLISRQLDEELVKTKQLNSIVKKKVGFMIEDEKEDDFDDDDVPIPVGKLAKAKIG